MTEQNPPQRALLMTLTNPVEGAEDDYNEWYSGTHLREILAVPGFVRAQRFKLIEEQPGPAGDPQYRYLAIYHIEGSADEAFAALSAAVPGLNISPSLDTDSAMTRWVQYEPPE